MSDTTPSGTGEPTAINTSGEGNDTATPADQATKTESAKDEPRGDAAKNGSDRADDEKTLSPSELAKEFEAKPDTAAPDPEAQRTADREASAKGLEADLVPARDRVYAAAQGEGTLEERKAAMLEAIKLERPHLRGSLMREAEGFGSPAPGTEQKAGEAGSKKELESWYAEKQADEQFNQILPGILEAAGLDKQTANAKEGRAELLREMNARIERGSSKPEALQDAAARLGYLSQEKIKAARDQGWRAGSQYLPPAGNPSKASQADKPDSQKSDADLIADIAAATGSKTK